MALVVMCGQPRSGKSAAAAFLAGILRSHPSGFKVRVIDEPSLHLDPNHGYADMVAEKNLRGVLRSEVDRSLSKDSITIVDSLNNIKGYRYELWCLARAASLKYCVVFCDVEESICRIWNQDDKFVGETIYHEKIFDDLVKRFEKPDGRNRWDSPLFELHPSEEVTNDSSSAIVGVVSYLTTKPGSRSRNACVLQPTIATQNAHVSDANSLYEMDQATQEVLSAVVEAQSQGINGPVIKIDLGQSLPNITLQRPVGLPELRRLRKTFIKLAGQTSLSGPPPPSDASSVKRMFAEYLTREIGAA